MNYITLINKAARLSTRASKRIDALAALEMNAEITESNANKFKEIISNYCTLRDAELRIAKHLTQKKEPITDQYNALFKEFDNLFKKIEAEEKVVSSLQYQSQDSSPSM